MDTAQCPTPADDSMPTGDTDDSMPAGDTRDQSNYDGIIDKTVIKMENWPTLHDVLMSRIW